MITDSVYLRPIDYDNVVNLFKGTIDHVIVKKESYYVLIIHGSDFGFVQYNGKLVTFQEVASLIRKELNYPSTERLNVLVCCCYAQSQKEYIDVNNYIKPMYSNNQELLCELHPSFCTFSYTN